MSPIRGQIYTVEQIMKLDLQDKPFLRFEYNLMPMVVSTSHMTREQVVSVMGDRKFRYDRTTSEWIPLFTYVDERPIGDVVEIWKVGNDRPEYIATPKGWSR